MKNEDALKYKLGDVEHNKVHDKAHIKEVHNEIFVQYNIEEHVQPKERERDDLEESDKNDNVALEASGSVLDLVNVWARRVFPGWGAAGVEDVQGPLRVLEFCDADVNDRDCKE